MEEDSARIEWRSGKFENEMLKCETCGDKMHGVTHARMLRGSMHRNPERLSGIPIRGMGRYQRREVGSVGSGGGSKSRDWCGKKVTLWITKKNGLEDHQVSMDRHQQSGRRQPELSQSDGRGRIQRPIDRWTICSYPTSGSHPVAVGLCSDDQSR